MKDDLGILLDVYLYHNYLEKGNISDFFFHWSLSLLFFDYFYRIGVLSSWKGGEGHGIGRDCNSSCSEKGLIKDKFVS